MWQWLKRVGWSLFHPSKIRLMRQAWRTHMASIQEYHALKRNFTKTKRQSGPGTLRAKRRKIRKSARQVVETCGVWLEHSTELPWIS